MKRAELHWSAAVFDLFTADASFGVFTIYKSPLSQLTLKFVTDKLKK